MILYSVSMHKPFTDNFILLVKGRYEEHFCMGYIVLSWEPNEHKNGP